MLWKSKMNLEDRLTTQDVVDALYDDNFDNQIPIDQQFKENMNRILSTLEAHQAQLEAIIFEAQQKHKGVSSAVEAIKAGIACINEANPVSLGA